MKTTDFMTFEAFNAPETTPQALIDTRKYIGAWLFYNVTRRIFHAVMNKLERLNYQGSTIKTMQVAHKLTTAQLKKLNAPKCAIKAYLKDITLATRGALLDKSR